MVANNALAAPDFDLLIDSTRAALAQVITQDFKGQIALVSSFGAESAVLLHMVAAIDPATPVLFLDTLKLFGETQRYRNQLSEKLGLTDVRSISPTAPALAAQDPDGMLFHKDPDQCCDLRKTQPLDAALAPFAAWITGRKRFQSESRNQLAFREDNGAKVKFNPLFNWDRSDLEAYFTHYDLPQHPLVADGYLSIGCYSCTDRVRPGEDPRAGRWRGQNKIECGIHRPA